MMTKMSEKDERIMGNLGTYGFIVLAIIVWWVGFPFIDNSWPVVTGVAFWLLAVANAVITNLKIKIIELERKESE